MQTYYHCSYCTVLPVFNIFLCLTRVDGTFRIPYLVLTGPAEVWGQLKNRKALFFSFEDGLLIE
jgi:hypothetical protein